jgi:hypothetical protein
MPLAHVVQILRGLRNRIDERDLKPDEIKPSGRLRELDPCGPAMMADSRLDAGSSRPGPARPPTRSMMASSSSQQARVLGLAGARMPKPGEVRAYVVLDRRNRPATAAPTPTAVYVPAACPAMINDTTTCGRARAIADNMLVLDHCTQNEYTISIIRNPCGHVELHEALLNEADRLRLEETG